MGAGSTLLRQQLHQERWRWIAARYGTPSLETEGWPSEMAGLVCDPNSGVLRGATGWTEVAVAGSSLPSAVTLPSGYPASDPQILGVADDGAYVTAFGLLNTSAGGTQPDYFSETGIAVTFGTGWNGLADLTRDDGADWQAWAGCVLVYGGVSYAVLGTKPGDAKTLILEAAPISGSGSADLYQVPGAGSGGPPVSVLRAASGYAVVWGVPYGSTVFSSSWRAATSEVAGMFWHPVAGTVKAVRPRAPGKYAHAAAVDGRLLLFSRYSQYVGFGSADNDEVYFEWSAPGLPWDFEGHGSGAGRIYHLPGGSIRGVATAGDYVYVSDGTQYVVLAKTGVLSAPFSISDAMEGGFFTGQAVVDGDSILAPGAESILRLTPQGAQAIPLPQEVGTPEHLVRLVDTGRLWIYASGSMWEFDLERGLAWLLDNLPFDPAYVAHSSETLWDDYSRRYARRYGAPAGPVELITTEYDFGDPGRRDVLRGVRLYYRHRGLVDATVTVKVRTRDGAWDERAGSSVQLTLTADGREHVARAGFYLAGTTFQVKVSADNPGVMDDVELIGLEIEWLPGGGGAW